MTTKECLVRVVLWPVRKVAGWVGGVLGAVARWVGRGASRLTSFAAR